ncbi:MAG: sugar phosphate isomerase/epimerase [Thermodesulfovibrionales bacterium]
MRDNRLNLEIYLSSSILDSLGPDDVRRTARLLDYRPSLSIHAPFMDLSPGAVDILVRDVTVRRFSHVLEIAEILSPRSVVFHSGYEKWKYALRPDIWLEKSIQTWEPLRRRAESLGTMIAIENIFEDEPSNLLMLMETLGSPHFGICFDTGHCNLFSRVPLKAWMDALVSYIVELHLHDNNGSSDQHLPVGEGTFDFRTFFDLLGSRDCVATIEAHSPDRVIRSLSNLVNYFK